MDDHGVANIKEAGSFADLLKGGLTEGLLDDDVKELVHDGLTVKYLVGVGHAYSYHRLVIHMDFLLFVFKHGFEFACVLEGGQSVDALARADKGS